MKNAFFSLTNLIFKRSSYMQWLFWVIYQKLKRNLRLAFGTHFPLFFRENVPNLIISQLTETQCHTFFPPQDIKQKVLLNSCLDN